MTDSPRTRASRRDCTCGYLDTGVPPERLCMECGDRALADWIAEEKSLLGRMPGYAAEVAEILRDTAQRQEKALKARANEPLADAQWERNKGGRRLARLRRQHRRELDGLAQERWVELAALLGRDRREGVRKDARRFAKRGLGGAALTALGLEAIEVLVKRMGSGR